MNTPLSDPVTSNSGTLELLLRTAEELRCDMSEAVEDEDVTRSMEAEGQLHVILMTWVFPIPEVAALDISSLTRDEYVRLHHSVVRRLKEDLSDREDGFETRADSDLLDCSEAGLEALRNYLKTTSWVQLASPDELNRLQGIVMDRWKRARTPRRWTMVQLLETLAILPDEYLLLRHEFANVQLGGVVDNPRSQIGALEELPLHVRWQAQEIAAWVKSGDLRLWQPLQARVTGTFQTAKSVTAESLGEILPVFRRMADAIDNLMVAAKGSRSRMGEAAMDAVANLKLASHPILLEAIAKLSNKPAHPAQDAGRGDAWLGDLWQALAIPQLPSVSSASSHETWSVSGVLWEGLGIFYAEKQDSTWYYVEVLVVPDPKIQGLRCKVLDPCGNVACVSDEFDLKLTATGHRKGSLAFAIPTECQPGILEWELVS